jgi:hypothetical protein
MVLLVAYAGAVVTDPGLPRLFSFFLAVVVTVRAGDAI